MRVVVMGTMFLAAASAMFVDPRPQASGPGVSQTGPSSPFGSPMPDMGMVMSMVRQTIKMILPKLMANPGLMAAILSEGNGPGKPAVMGPPNSMTGPGTQPGPMGGNPVPMGGNPFGINPSSIFNPLPTSQAASAMGGPGYMPTSSSDAFKDMRLMQLLRDPAVGLMRDPNISYYIPRGRVYGWSLPDIAKDQIMFAIQRRGSMRRGLFTPKEKEILSLIGDPAEMMPGIFGSGSKPRPTI
ncbi:uncharacterized protein LOC143277543 [Babylonia areolata]|uniref:uncharacterized protein LOC143277543 n=1 Tax=Babylonia areolata TaxID=304850 RepID=UPI003FD08E17